MISGSMIYWITRLDAVNTLLVASLISSAIVAGVTGIVIFVAGCDGEDKEVKSGVKFLLSRCLPLIMLFSMLLVFTPTTRELCTIVVIPAVANNEAVQEIPIKLVEIAGEWMEELRPDSAKESAGAKPDSSP